MSPKASNEAAEIASIKNYKAGIHEINDALHSKFRTVGIDKLLQEKTNYTDNILIDLWEKHSLAETSISLNAVGGYGRKELHLFSDIDICIILSNDTCDSAKTSIERFVTDLWDLGIEIGHSVRTLKQAKQEIEKDVVTATNLLDIRTLCGDETHANSILEALYDDKLWNSKKFWNAKFGEQKQRHEKLNQDSFSMQPNLKNSPGGLRDIQTIIWVARKHYSVNDPDALNRLGYFTDEEFSELLECQYFIWRVRWCLHYVAKRAENQLLIEYQAEVAELMGFGGNDNTAIEKMMRQLFRAMKRAYELNQMMMMFSESDRNKYINKDVYVINDSFEIRGTLIHARHKDVFIERKQIISLFVHIAQNHDKVSEISPQTLRLLRQVRRRILGDLQDFYECRQEFITLLRLKHGLGLALDILHRHGLLSVYFSQWREIVGQMQFDFFHAYTLDEHIYRTLKNLYSFELKKVDKSQLLAANIYNNLDNKLPLKIVAIFHDIAKGRGGDHSILGSIDAVRFADFHGLTRAEIKLIQWLVENHLLMSVTAQQQDIYDIDIISEFAQKVGTQEKLDMLYCLTIADISATNDNLWNDWKASLIEHLYVASKKALRNGLENLLEYKSVVKSNKKDALKLLHEEYSIDDDFINQIPILWKKIPTPFFGRYSAAEIANYTEKIIKVQPHKTIISVDGGLRTGCNEVFVYIKDQKGLFVSLFKTLSNLNIATQEAHITITSDDYVIETLKILDIDNVPIEDSYRLQELETRLHEVLIEGKEIQEPVEPRFLSAFESDISVDFLKARKKNKTLLSVSSPNNPRLMEKICQVFQSLDLNIQSAKINTIGEVVDNVFLLANKNRKQLTEKEQKLLKDQIIKTLG